MKIMSKTDLMLFVKAGRQDESFVHETEGEFNITQTYDKIFNNEIPFTITNVYIKDLAVQLRKIRDICSERVMTLTTEEYMSHPGLAIYYKETNEHLICDGSHRMTRRALEGFDGMAFFVILPEHVVKLQSDQYRQIYDWGGQEYKNGKLTPRKH